MPPCKAFANGSGNPFIRNKNRKHYASKAADSLTLPGSLHPNQTAAKEGLIGHALDRLGAGIAFLWRALRPRAHSWRMSRHEGAPNLLYIFITDLVVRSKRFSNANLPWPNERAITRGRAGAYDVRAGLLTELLSSGQLGAAGLRDVWQSGAQREPASWLALQCGMKANPGARGNAVKDF